MVVHCAQCGKAIERKPSQIKKNANSFCSKTCQNKSMMRGQAAACSWRGTPIYRPLSALAERNFCSNGCRLSWFGKWTKEVLNVPGHSAGHKAPHLSRLNCLRNPASSLCSNKRYIKPSVYRNIAKTTLDRNLGSSEVVHHINGDRADNRPANLRVMSREEHGRLHMRIAQSRYAKGGGAQCQKTTQNPEESRS